KRRSPIYIMYTFRFNPVFEQWVMVGGPVVAPRSLKPADLLDVGRRDGFQAASYPRQPFILEPPRTPHELETSLLYQEQPPVGEYELLLYKQVPDFFSWDTAHWEAWLSLVQQRLCQALLNPHLHYVQLVLHTSALESIEGYQRVGDLIVTSHP